ncbi:MAG: nickel-dependent lactate racemase, partial [Anaerolineae bacterium]|nr:nickel-dependent lactate racemase [Anaerolineae bacterium]
MTTAAVVLPYGRGSFEVRIPAGQTYRVLLPRSLAAPDDDEGLVERALQHPIGTARLRDLLYGGHTQRVAIVTSDLTRPCPSHRLIPAVLDELGAAGVPDDQIIVVMALGLHRPMTDKEIVAAVGPEVVSRVRVLNHDPNDVTYLGTTSAGTPVEFFRPIVNADVRICLGNIDLHYFAGYSGGAKAVLPGCASRAT